MGNLLSDKEKQKKYIDERDRKRDQTGRRRRAPFNLAGFIELILGIIISVTGLSFIIHNFLPNMIGHIHIGLGIGLFIFGVVMLVIADRFGRRKY